MLFFFLDKPGLWKHTHKTTTKPTVPDKNTYLFHGSLFNQCINYHY
jgi:hypothetical protein